ncbi:MAG: hypothetical protein D9C04_04055 [Nitrosopumilus sp. B06]|nr:MAG: hypothetical protein EB828_04830 [Nitrosopumilus sp. D6]RNJ79675.1 MAG: hypothetical protein D9C04_04055 [Nitrosopumilus sp. B06]
MEWALGIAAIVLLVTGLVGQAFEMRKIRSAHSEATPGIFLDARNYKWYALIGVGMVLWYVAERI